MGESGRRLRRQPGGAWSTRCRRRRSAPCRAPRRYRPAARRLHGDAIDVRRELLDPVAEPEGDVRLGAPRRRPAPPADRRGGSPNRARRSGARLLAKRDARDLAAGPAGHHADRVPARHRGRQPFAQAERQQDARGIGRKLDAGAGFLQAAAPARARVTRQPARASASAAVSPAMPAPAMMTWRVAATARSGKVRRRACASARTRPAARRAGRAPDRNDRASSNRGR